MTTCCDTEKLKKRNGSKCGLMEKNEMALQYMSVFYQMLVSI